MHILSSVYHGLSGFARTVKDNVVSRFRGKKTEVVKHPVRKMTGKKASSSDSRHRPVTSKGFLLAKKLSDQSLPAHKVSGVELPPRFPYVETPNENQTFSEPSSRARRILTALMPGNNAVPEDSNISFKQAKRWQIRRLRKGLQTIKRETGLNVSIRNFDHQAAKLTDFLTGNGATPGYQDIKFFCDTVTNVMEKADSLPRLVKLAVTEYMFVLSDLGQAAQLKALEKRQQLAKRFLPGQDGFKAHCLRRNIDPDSALNLHDLKQFQEKLMGWHEPRGQWHQGLVESLELSSMEALTERLKAELEIFIDKIEGDAPEPGKAATIYNNEQIQAEVSRLYAQHGVGDLPDRQPNPMVTSAAEQHPVLQSATQYQVQPSGNLQNHSVTPLEKARLHHWVFEQQLADVRASHEFDAPEQVFNIPTYPLPTLVLRNSRGVRIDSDFMKNPELDEPAFTMHVVHCDKEDVRQIDQALLNTPGFESKEILDRFKDTMQSFTHQCYQYAIGTSLPSKVFSENDTHLIHDSRQRINSAMETLLANPEADTTTAFHYLRMQEAVLENFLKMNGMS
ncbi:hypothetical protein [Endozoicomonas sp. 8E]|uniref:hypothetical protein n=1 Tax=Endozoicomonas sp. 8E TaxID=3035692 RepID=UPI0029390EE6|nr:hypothetical protein [Endozoicomonas sp. 8E]WOG26292.1 hypothetical protein P6910_17205 [Endozoicomonas sp. 8E]